MKQSKTAWLKKALMCFLAINLTLIATIAYADTTPPPSGESSHYAQISDDVSLFYHDSGKGQVLLFIPGWTLSSEVFKSQISYFDKKFRVIALDPRSQGRSSITLENNNYTQHGIDLARFIDKLKLNNIVLVAWSWGCNDAYAYIRLKGVNNLRGFVCIDASPKSSGGKNEWAVVDYPDWGAAFIQPMMYHRLQFTPVWAQSMVERKLTSEELNWLAQASLRTPTFAALQMALDAIYADYRPEAELLSSNKIPTLDFVSQHKAANATQWLHANAPNASIKVMGKHLLFWEYPDEFNQTLDDFLNRINKQ